MAKRATRQRWGTTSRQRNRKQTPSEIHGYVRRTWGDRAAAAWWRAYDKGGLDAAAEALVPYRYLHRAG
jgi:hypothetical protein